MSMSGHASPFLSETAAWVWIRPGACHTRHLPTGGMIGQHRGTGGVRTRTAPNAYPRSAWWHFMPTTTVRQGAVCWLRAPAFRRSPPPPGSERPRAGRRCRRGLGLHSGRAQGAGRNPQPHTPCEAFDASDQLPMGHSPGGHGTLGTVRLGQGAALQPPAAATASGGACGGLGVCHTGRQNAVLPDRPPARAPSSRSAPGMANGSGQRVRLRLGLQPGRVLAA